MNVNTTSTKISMETLAKVEDLAARKGYSAVEEEDGLFSLYSGHLVAFVGSLDSVVKLLHEVRE